ncbi:MAG: transposase, partial [Eubacteriales bacterium]|nr:transposase [Eubacteriales bacterium]
KLHMMIGNVKAYINGTFHGVGKYLQLYLDEFCYRFNRKGFGVSRVF